MANAGFLTDKPDKSVIFSTDLSDLFCILIKQAKKPILETTYIII